MPTLKDISIRLKSIKNIQKITQSMKMVSAAKYARAERDLKHAKSFGAGSQKFYEAAELEVGKDAPKQLLIAVSSDRGLCGGIHSSVAKGIKADVPEKSGEYKIVPIGDKARSLLQRLYGKDILFHVNEVGRLPPVFADASKIANQILNSGYEFNVGEMYYNRFKSVVSYKTSKLPVFSMETISQSEKINLYDDVDEATLQSYQEFSLASLIYYAMKEGACSEQSSRMSAMDNASKNAGEMIDKLTLTFNRTRQAVITRELIEIISGAAAL